MRGGRFLAEDSPDEILRRYNTDSLEDAFLKLSILQNRGKRRRSSISSDIIAAKAAAMPVNNIYFIAYDELGELFNKIYANIINIL